MKNIKEELFSPAFNVIFPAIDEMIKNFHPDIKVRKLYALLRTKGFSQKETEKYINDLLTQ